MPLKNGELNASELRRLIKKHNQLMSIKIPPKTNRDGLIKLIESNGYKINHAGQKLEPSVKMKRKPIVNLPPAPAKKTAEEKAEAKKKKQSKAEKQEEEAFESRKKKIEAIQKLRQKKTEPKKEEPKKDDDKKEEILLLGDKVKKEYILKRNERFAGNQKLKSLYKKTAHSILGISEKASPEEIREAYKPFLKFHPDKNGGDKKKTEKFTMATEAKNLMLRTIKEAKNKKENDDAKKKSTEKDFKTEYETLLNDNKELLQSKKMVPPYRNRYDYFTTVKARLTEKEFNSEMKVLKKAIQEIKEAPKKEAPKKEEPKKDDDKKEEQKKSQSLIDKENDIKKVIKSVLTDDLKKAYNDNNEDMMKKLFNKKLNEIAKIKSKYSGKSVSTEKKQLQKMGGIGFAIKKWAEGKKVDSVNFMNVDVTDLFKK